MTTDIYTPHGIIPVPGLTAHFIPSVCDSESEKTERLEVVWIDRDRARVRHPESKMIFKPVEDVPLEWLILDQPIPQV